MKIHRTLALLAPCVLWGCGNPGYPLGVGVTSVSTQEQLDAFDFNGRHHHLVMDGDFESLDPLQDARGQLSVIELRKTGMERIQIQSALHVDSFLIASSDARELTLEVDTATTVNISGMEDLESVHMIVHEPILDFEIYNTATRTIHIELPEGTATGFLTAHCGETTLEFSCTGGTFELCNADCANVSSCCPIAGD